MPVYKLGLQFNGDPRNLLSFIERVEELAQARRISKADLFESACDLFTDKATFWLRQIKPQVNDWDSLISKLKQDFLKSGFDDEIWEQIKTRYQGRQEPVVIFIACMESLFSRLSRPVIEVTKVKYIRKGLQPEYRKRLALNGIETVVDLSNLCKKLEEADVLDLESRSLRNKPAINLIDSELAYVSDTVSTESSTKHRQPKKPQSKFNKKPTPVVASTSRNSDVAVAGTSTATDNRKPVICWKCNQANHTYNTCMARVKKRFCFKCGCPDVTVRTCTKCQGN